MLAHDQAPRVTNVDYLPTLEQQAGRFSDDDIQQALSATRTATRQLGQNVNARLVTEVLALHLPRAEPAIGFLGTMQKNIWITFSLVWFLLLF